MKWDDLRILAAVRDEGTYVGAGLRLRIDETTVGRRLARIERALGLRLFEAVDGLRKPTRECEIVLAHVKAITGHVTEIGRVGESLPALSGRFRIASTNGVAEEILSPQASRLLVHNPGLTIHFLTSSENVKFSRWQADLAIRLRKPDRGDFTISKLGEFRLFLIEPATGSDAQSVVCAYPDHLGAMPESQFLRAKGLHERSHFFCDNIRVIRNLISTYQAIGVLPEYACRDLLADRRLRASLLPRRRDVWLLVQNHLKRDPAARVVIDWIRDCFQELSPG
jgi:DNA-binding transcriptional LysR family regulator